jgi:hypothetical protein
MVQISHFDKFITSLLEDEGFRAKVGGDVLGLVPVAEREGVVRAALECIFGGPRGVRKMEATKGHLHITNNKNWRPFCAQLLEHMKAHRAKEIDEMKKHSSMFLSYNAFWPDCNDLLAADVEKAFDREEGGVSVRSQRRRLGRLPIE